MLRQVQARRRRKRDTVASPHSASKPSPVSHPRIKSGGDEPSHGSNIRVQAYWLAPVKPPNILTTSFDNASLKVRAGALVVTDGERKITYEPRGHKPQAIVMTGWGGYITIEAMRFCADYKIAVIVLNWEHDFMSVVTQPSKKAYRIAVAQLNANRISIARVLIQAKIEQHICVGAITQSTAQTYIERINKASTISDILMIEAHAAKQAWANRTVSIKWRTVGTIPASWKLPWTLRRRLDKRSAYRATDPINSMINLVLGVHVGRMTVAIAASGLNPALGIIHSTPRHPLAYDAIEILRPQLEDAVFNFIETNALSPSDFIRASDGQVRTYGDLTHILLDATAIKRDDINRSVAWLCGQYPFDKLRAESSDRSS